ncbi:intraflagellar transport protein 74 homolog [Corticium candelabrum]|uniref:intraflagellar transport protein 74 homolog n=1 Tax=Corticium candelabrum TaxID=121492 RepID=UPI002E271DB9|nr:intraflagellar transport protein 74 homolog [Corticium candelabrum]
MSESGRPPTSRVRATGSGTSRPMSRGRAAAAAPQSTAARPPTGFRMPTSAGAPPGLAARPGTRGIVGGSGSQVRVSDRPVTQQGLTGIKTGSRGPERVVHDKTYYMGLLRTKISELNSEILKLNREMEQFNTDNAAYLTFEKRAEGLAGELKELQGQLADYNTLLDKTSTDTDVMEVVSEYSTVKNQNDREESGLDVLFTEKQEKERQLQKLESDIEKERAAADNLVNEMDPEDQQHYSELKDINDKLNQELEARQHELDDLIARTRAMDEELSMSQVKQEAAVLYEKLNAVKRKRESLRGDVERETRETPQEERERLLRQVKDDSQEAATMERRVTELQEKIQGCREEVVHLERELEEYEGEKGGKYQELKKKEEIVNAFFDSYDDTKQEELSKRESLERSIVEMLEQMSQDMVESKQMPSVAEFRAMQEHLSFKERERVKSKATAESLNQDFGQLTKDLMNVQELEGKISSELVELKEKIEKMKADIEVFSDLAALRDQADEKKLKLTEEKQHLLRRRETFKKHLLRLSSQADTARVQLEDNETHSQLLNLERKWQHHEQNNFMMREYIADKTTESDYQPVKNQVDEQLTELNGMIIHSLQTTGSGY